MILVAGASGNLGSTCPLRRQRRNPTRSGAVIETAAVEWTCLRPSGFAASTRMSARCQRRQTRSVGLRDDDATARQARETHTYFVVVVWVEQCELSHAVLRVHGRVYSCWCCSLCLPFRVQTIGVVDVQETASCRSCSSSRPDEVQFDAVAADDQIVPFLGRCSTVLEPEIL